MGGGRSTLRREIMEKKGIGREEGREGGREKRRN